MTSYQISNRSDMMENELIAEFMGVKPTSFKNMANDIAWRCANGLNHTTNWATPEMAFNRFCEESAYHISWDWLMPVVEKIATISPVQQVSVSTLKTRVWFSVSSQESYIEAQGDSMINKCYNTVVEFIKWHNAQ